MSDDYDRDEDFYDRVKWHARRNGYNNQPMEVMVKEYARRTHNARARRESGEFVNGGVQVYDEAQHRGWLYANRRLRRSPSTRYVALEMSQIMGLAQRDAYGSKPHPISAKLVADRTGLGIKTARRHMRKATELCAFRRIDDGIGGRSGLDSAAMYVPTIGR